MSLASIEVLVSLVEYANDQEDTCIGDLFVQLLRASGVCVPLVNDCPEGHVQAITTQWLPSAYTITGSAHLLAGSFMWQLSHKQFIVRACNTSSGTSLLLHACPCVWPS